MKRLMTAAAGLLLALLPAPYPYAEIGRMRRQLVGKDQPARVRLSHEVINCNTMPVTAVAR